MHQVLVIEDERDIRNILRALLEADHYRFIEADNASRGEIEARSHKPDLILVDLGLPDGNGINLIRRIRTWSPVPIIVLSARTMEDQKIAALDAGADDYVTKPFSTPELLARVRAALRRNVRNTGIEVRRSADRSDTKRKPRPRRRAAPDSARVPSVGIAGPPHRPHSQAGTVDKRSVGSGAAGRYRQPASLYEEPARQGRTGPTAAEVPGDRGGFGISPAGGLGHWREKVRAEPGFVDRPQKAWFLGAAFAGAPSALISRKQSASPNGSAS
jgi:CheY-like chemotaxis protein